MITIYIIIALFIIMGVLVVIDCYRDIKNKEESKFLIKALDYLPLITIFSLFIGFIEIFIKMIFASI